MGCRWQCPSCDGTLAATARSLRRLACCDRSLAATLCRVRKVLRVSGGTFPPRLQPLAIRRGDEEMFLPFTTTVEVKGQTLPSQGACGFQPTPGASMVCWWGHSLPPALGGPQGSSSPPSPLGILRASLSPPACTKLSFRLFFTSGQYLLFLRCWSGLVFCTLFCPLSGLDMFSKANKITWGIDLACISLVFQSTKHLLSWAPCRFSPRKPKDARAQPLWVTLRFPARRDLCSEETRSMPPPATYISPLF